MYDQIMIQPSKGTRKMKTFGKQMLHYELILTLMFGRKVRARDYKLCFTKFQLQAHDAFSYNRICTIHLMLGFKNEMKKGLISKEEPFSSNLTHLHVCFSPAFSLLNVWVVSEFMSMMCVIGLVL